MRPAIVSGRTVIAATLAGAAMFAAAAVFDAARAMPPWPVSADGRAGSVVLVQARNTNLAGVWTSAAGDKFEITVDGDKVLMATAGTLTGRISGNFDGAAFSGAYQTSANPPDRGVVRFLLNAAGILEGTWQSYVSGKQGNWVLKRQ